MGGSLGISFIFNLLAIAVAVLCVFAYVFVADTMPAAVICIVALLVISLLGIALISSTLSGIYSAAVYDYAVSGSAGEFFREDLIKNAFEARGRI